MGRKGCCKSRRALFIFFGWSVGLNGSANDGMLGCAADAADMERWSCSCKKSFVFCYQGRRGTKKKNKKKQKQNFFLGKEKENCRWDTVVCVQLVGRIFKIC